MLLDITYLKTGRPYKSLASRYKGPFKVIEALSYIVKLQLLDNIKVNNIFYVSKLKAYKVLALPP